MFRICSGYISSDDLERIGIRGKAIFRDFDTSYLSDDEGKDEDEADDDEELVEDVLDVHWQGHVHLIDVPEQQVNMTE